MGRAHTLTLAATLVVGAGGARAQAPGTQAGSAGSCVPPVIHVLVDRSGSVLRESKSHGLALDALDKAVAPQIDDLGAHLYLYAFGSKVEKPTRFDSTKAFRDYLQVERRSRPTPYPATSLTAVWKEIVTRAEDESSQQVFLVFSDFVHSVIPASRKSRNDVDTGDLPSEWRALLDDERRLARRPGRSLVRFVVLPVGNDDRQQMTQNRTLAYLGLLAARFRPQVVSVNDHDLASLATHIPFVLLSSEPEGLRVTNIACVPINALALRQIYGDQPVEVNRSLPPLLSLGPGVRDNWPYSWPKGVKSVAVLGQVRGGPERLLSGELTRSLAEGDIQAFAYLIGRDVQLFMSPMVAVANQVSGSVDVLPQNGDDVLVRADFAIQRQGENQLVTVHEQVPDNKLLTGLDDRVRLRVVVQEANTFMISDVPLVRIAPVALVLKNLAFVFLPFVLLSLYAATRVRTLRFSLKTAMSTVFSLLLAAGSVDRLYLDIAPVWMSVFRAACGLFIAGWLAFCITRAWPPVVRDGVDTIAKRIPEPSGWARYLDRRPYLHGRLGGLFVGGLMGALAWWLLQVSYDDVAQQRLPLDVLKAVAQAAHTN